MELTVNAHRVAVRSTPDTPLLWVLRDELSLTGTKYGCGASLCGACTVLVDGSAVRCCNLPVEALAGKSVTTIEGLAGTRFATLQQAWIAHQVPQCGYCQSGILMALAGLLQANARPAEDEVNAAVSNICRCGTYPALRRALREVIEAV